MKKILVCIMSLVVMCGCFAVTAFAASADGKAPPESVVINAAEANTDAVNAKITIKNATKNLDDKVFTFLITPADETLPAQTLEIKGTGTKTLDIICDKAGTYIYRVENTTPAEEGENIDRTAYTVTVFAYYNDNQQLSVAVYVLNEKTGEKTDCIAYVSNGKEPTEPTKPSESDNRPDTGDTTKVTIFAFCGFVACIGIGFFVYKMKKNNKTDTKQN